jgi:hypothetical protein
MSPAPLGELGGVDCEPPSPFDGLEVQGTGTGVTAFGQFQGATPNDLSADGQTVKMVLRMSGTGELKTTLTAPDGSARSLDWGPEPHTQSNYQRPGDERGTGFSFDQEGCWAIAFKRGESDSATFWLEVARAS